VVHPLQLLVGQVEPALHAVEPVELVVS